MKKQQKKDLVLFLIVIGLILLFLFFPAIQDGIKNQIEDSRTNRGVPVTELDDMPLPSSSGGGGGG